MKLFAGILGLGTLAAILQGVAGTFLAQRFVPDLGFLLAVALGLSWRGLAGGVALVAFLGYLTDLLSGSILGQHVILRMFVFAAARLGSRHLSLIGAMPRALFPTLKHWTRPPWWSALPRPTDGCATRFSSRYSGAATLALFPRLRLSLHTARNRLPDSTHSAL